MSTRNKGGLMIVLILILLVVQTIGDWEFSLWEQVCAGSMFLFVAVMIIIGPWLDKEKGR